MITRLDPKTIGDEGIVIMSEDGTESFLFSPDGRHVKTVDPRDPSVEFRSFEYVDGLLRSFTERGLTTEIVRTGSSIDLVSPFGQTTRIALDAATGYATRIERGLGESSSDAIIVAHDHEGLLRSMKDGSGTHTYEYAPNGRLTGDTLESSDGEVVDEQTLSRQWSRSSHTNGEEEESNYSMIRTFVGVERKVTEADGTGYSLSTDSDVMVQEFSDGTGIETLWGYLETAGTKTRISETITLPSGGALTRTYSGTVDASGNIRTEQETVGTSTTTTLTNANTNTRTVTSPLGRTVVATYDDYGRTKTIKVGDLSTQRFHHYADSDPEKGQLASVTVDGEPEPLAEFDYVASGPGAGYLLISKLTSQARTELWSYDFGEISRLPSEKVTGGILSS